MNKTIALILFRCPKIELQLLPVYCVVTVFNVDFSVLVLLRSVVMMKMMWGLLLWPVLYSGVCCCGLCYTVGFPTHVSPNLSIHSSALYFDCLLLVFVWLRIIKLQKNLIFWARPQSFFLKKVIFCFVTSVRPCGTKCGITWLPVDGFS